MCTPKDWKPEHRTSVEIRDSKHHSHCSGMSKAPVNLPWTLTAGTTLCCVCSVLQGQRGRQRKLY